MFKEFIKNNIVNITASIIIGIGNWLFRFLILKLAPAESSTSFASFYALVLIFSFPGTWITLMTVRLGIKFKETVVELFKKHTIVFFTILGGCMAILTYILIVSKFGIIFLLLAFALIIIGFFSSYFRGLLQHEMLFDKLGFVGILEVVLKISIFLIFIVLGQKSISMFAAAAIQTFISFIILNLLTVNLKSHFPAENITRIGILTLFYSLGFLLFTNIDTVFAKIYLPVNQNLSYIGLSQLSNLILFGATALINVLLPSIQKYKDKKDIIKLSFLTGILVTIGGIFVILFTLVSYDKVSGLFSFSLITQPMAIFYLISIIILSIAQIPLTILLVKSKKDLIYIVLSSVILQPLLYILLGRTLDSFIYIYVLVSIVIFVLSVLSLFRYHSVKQILNINS